MTSKLKCPFCQTELEQAHDKPMFGCPKCLHIADGAFWAKAIQAKNDLAAARAEIAFNKEHYDFWDGIKTNTIQVYEEHYSSAINAIKNICNIAEDVEAYYGGVSVNYRKMVEDMKNSAQTVLKQLNQDHKE